MGGRNRIDAKNNVSVYTLGQFGINRVKSPIHIQNGELLSAQNATVKLVQGQLALSKRDGMALINTDAAAGTLGAIINVPISGFGNAAVCTTATDLDSATRRGVWSPDLGLFVVVPRTGSAIPIATSPDGITWTERTNPATSAWSDVCWSPSLSLFVTVGAGSGGTDRVATSPNGITWTLRTAAANRDWQCVTWSPDLNLFVAGAQTGVATASIMTSPDGINWTSRDGTSAGGRAVVWSPELSLFAMIFKITGSTQQVQTSPDGINWTRRNTPNQTGWNDIAWSPELDLFVAVGYPTAGGSTYSMYSADGTNWTAGDLTTGSVTDLNGIAWSPELHLFLHGGGVVTTGVSSNGVNWNLLTPNCSQATIEDVVYAAALEKFLVIGGDSLGQPVFELVG